jgi:hypothetical protein
MSRRTVRPVDAKSDAQMIGSVEFFDDVTATVPFR